MTKEQLEAQLHREMLEGIEETKRLKYHPQYFIEMMHKRGAAQAIRDLIDAPTESSGFTRLWEMKRLDLSVEAVVLNPMWHDIFTDAQRDVARRRLEAYGYRAEES